MLSEMFSWFYGLLNTLSGGDSTVKGFMTLGLLGGLGYCTKNLPKLFVDVIRRNTVTSMTFTRQGSYSMDLLNYAEFMKWFGKTKYADYDRMRKVTFDRDEPAFGPGVGFHWFFWNNRYFWFNVKRLDSSGTDIEKEEFTLFTLGRNNAVFERLVEEFRIKQDPNKIRIFTPNGEYWRQSGTLRLDVPDNMIIDPEVERQLFEPLDWFANNEEWYRAKGLDYKHTVILEGPGGTGKSSLAKLVARRYKRDIHQFNLATFGKGLRHFMTQLSPGDMLVIEDFEEVKSLHDRGGVSGERINVNDMLEDNGLRSLDIANADISLSEFLNILQGVIELDNIIIMMSTNHLWKIDPVVYRPSRVDSLIHVPFLKDPEIKKYIAKMYELPHYESDVVFEDTAPAKLSGLFKEYPFDCDGFVSKLKEKGSTPTQKVQREAIHLVAKE